MKDLPVLEEKLQISRMYAFFIGIWTGFLIMSLTINLSYLLRQSTPNEIISPVPEFRPSPKPSPEILLDPRIEIVKQFLNQYNSELANYANVFVEVADENNIDYRILPSIAMVESTGGKFTPSCAGYNPFGWTSTSSPCGYWRFDSFDEAIRHVGSKIGSGKTYTQFQQSGNISELAENIMSARKTGRIRSLIS